MGFFANLRNDIRTIATKVEQSVSRLYNSEKPVAAAVVADIHKDIVAVVSKLIDYVEANLPAVEAAAVGVAEKVAGPAAGVVAAVAPTIEAAVNAEVSKVAAAAATPTPTPAPASSPK